jgi:hypothetical protein
MPLIYRLPGRRARGPDLDAGLDQAQRVDGISRGRKRSFFRQVLEADDFEGKRTRPIWTLLTARDGTWTSYMSELWCTIEPVKPGTWRWLVQRGFSMDIMEGTSSRKEWAEAEVIRLMDSGIIAAAEKRKKLTAADWD